MAQRRPGRLTVRGCVIASVVAMGAGGSVAAAPIGLTAMSARPVPESPVGDKLVDRTVATFDSGVGSQVEYIAPDATTVLWVEGEGQAWHGKAYLRANARQICFRYEPRGDATAGAYEYCHMAEGYLASITQIVRGDPLSLRSGEPPFALPFAGPADIGALAAAAGVGAEIVPTPIPGR